MFDRVLLLGDQGETTYFGDIGPDASTMISYFESKGASQCQPDANPAEWVLDLTSQKMASQPESSSEGAPLSINWTEKWSTSQEKENVIQELDNTRYSDKLMPLQTHRGEFAASWLQQLTIVSKRIFQEYWRSPTYVYSKIALCAGVVRSRL